MGHIVLFIQIERTFPKDLIDVTLEKETVEFWWSTNITEMLVSKNRAIEDIYNKKQKQKSTCYLLTILQYGGYTFFYKKHTFRFGYSLDVS